MNFIQYKFIYLSIGACVFWFKKKKKKKRNIYISVVCHFMLSTLNLK